MDVALISPDVQPEIPHLLLKNANMAAPSDGFKLAYVSTQGNEEYTLMSEEQLAMHFKHIINHINKSRTSFKQVHAHMQTQTQSQDPSLFDYRLLFMPLECGNEIYTGPNISSIVNVLSAPDSFKFKRDWMFLVDSHSMKTIVKTNTDTPVIGRRTTTQIQSQTQTQTQTSLPERANPQTGPVQAQTQAHPIYKALDLNDPNIEIEIIPTANQNMFVVIFPKKTKIEEEEK